MGETCASKIGFYICAVVHVLKRLCRGKGVYNFFHWYYVLLWDHKWYRTPLFMQSCFLSGLSSAYGIGWLPYMWPTGDVSCWLKSHQGLSTNTCFFMGTLLLSTTLHNKKQMTTLMLRSMPATSCRMCPIRQKIVTGRSLNFASTQYICACKGLCGFVCYGCHSLFKQVVECLVQSHGGKFKNCASCLMYTFLQKCVSLCILWMQLLFKQMVVA